MSENDYDLTLAELTDRSVGRLACAEVFDVAAFEALKAHLWRKAVGLRQEYTLSKQVLSCIRLAISTIQSRAEYVPQVREHLDWVNSFEMILDRLIAGEVEDDRKPGVPRIA